jgi:hypothetical protein
MGDFGFYFGMGWDHIMSWDALDHLLFIAVLCAVYRVEQWKRVAVLVTAFTIGHSLTLALAAKELLVVPSDLVEFLIPCTIVLTALGNLFLFRGDAHRGRIAYIIAAVFGLVHGLGFANTLRMVIASDQNLAWSLFGFNLGLEAGQLIVVCVLLIISYLVLRFTKATQRDWIIFVSAAVFSLALKMALERQPF